MKKEQMLQINQWISSKFCFLVVGSMILGLLFPGFFVRLRSGVNTLLAVTMFTMALSCRFSDFGQVARLWKRLALILAISYGIIPLFALSLGKIILPSEPSLAAGLVLISLLPVAVTSAFWTETNGGSLPVTLSIISTTTLLSGLIIPVLMHLYVGAIVEFDSTALVIGLVKNVLIPVIIGIGVNQCFPDSTKAAKPYLDVGVKICLFLVIAINAAVIVPYLEQMGRVLLGVILAIIIHILACYIVGYCASRLVFPHRPDIQISILYTGAMRNNSAGIAIALAYFSPMVAVPVILSILFQQPMAALVTAVLNKMTRESRLADFPTTN